MRPLVVKTEQLDSCPNCGSPRLRHWCEAHDRQHGLSEQRFTYSLCTDCALVFLSMRPAEEEAYKFYPDDYGPYQVGREPAPSSSSPTQTMGQRRGGPRSFAGRSLTRLLGAVNHRVNALAPDGLAQKLEGYYEPRERGLKLLDFGCGSDAFLSRAAARGWDTLGVDFSEVTVRRVAEGGHRALLMSPGMWDEIEDESLDFVRMSHVFEHLYAPRHVLREVCRKMKVGATLHIAMPNPGGLSAKIFGSRWWGLECPRHVLLYSPEVLRRLLAELDFSVAETLHEVITKDFARSLGYLMHERGWIGRGEVEGMMHRPALAGTLRLPAKVAAALGLADRYHVFARKQ